MIEMEEITSISFDDESAITASKGLWLFNRNVVQSDEGCMSGRCGFFNSTADSKLELAYFSNAFDRFETFTVRFFYKRSFATPEGDMVLLNNYDCDLPGSIAAVSGHGYALASIANSTDYTAVFNPTVRIPLVSCITLL